MKTVCVLLIALAIGIGAGAQAYSTCARIFIPLSPFTPQGFPQVLPDGRLSTEFRRVNVEVEAYQTTLSRISGRIQVFSSFVEFFVSALLFALFLEKSSVYVASATFFPVWGIGIGAFVSQFSSTLHSPIKALLTLFDLYFILSALVGMLAAIAGARLGSMLRIRMVCAVADST